MPDIRSAIVSLLVADAGVGAVCGDRIYPSPRPQSATLPCLEYQVVDNIRQHWIDQHNGIATARVQLDCLAAELADCVALKQAIEELLDGYTGSTSIHVLWCAQESEADLSDLENDGSDTWVRRISVDYLAKYRTS